MGVGGGTQRGTQLLLSVSSPLSLSMDLGSSGVYDSPMAQDYYVRRFGFLFGGRRGMEGLAALQGNGLVDTHPRLVEGDKLMMNSVNIYYKAVMPEVYLSSLPKKYRSLALSKNKAMVE